jgi:hypothetical protein
LNIAVCHHHPHVHSDLKLGVDDVIRNGQRFLNLLADNGQWMVIHGHKHHPKIEYAQGEFRQPIVLASGSFSGRLEGENALVSKNYFHIIDIQRTSPRLAGQVRSWNWIPGLGWTEYASTPPEFPSRVGFGSSTAVDRLAQEVASIIGSRAAIRWEELTQQQPELAFLMPKQLRALISDLRDTHSIYTVYDDLNYPKQMGPELS